MPAVRFEASLLCPALIATALLVGLGPRALRAETVALGFEPTDVAQWNLGADPASVALDSTIAWDGGHSLRVDGRSRARFSRRLMASALRGDRLRIAAVVRTHGAAVPELWVRITSPSGLIYVDRAAARPGPVDAWVETSLEAPLSALAERVEVGGSVDGDGTAWFDGFTLETLDAAALPAPSPAATRYVDAALDILAQHSVRRRELDWPAIEARVLRQTRGALNAEDAYLAVRYAVGELDDGHSYFMTPAQMARLERTPVSNARTGRPPVEPQGLALDAGIAYVHVPGFAGGGHRAQARFASELQSAIAALDAGGACGFIVDLRDNSGGNLWPMLVGLGPLLGNGEAGAAVYPDSTRRSFWYRDGKAGLDEFVQLRVHTPYALEGRPAPVAVLTGRATASAGEVLAAAFRAVPEARSFGAPTRGAHTGTRVFPLADGAALVLAVAATSNRDGETFTGPIEPDERVAGPRRRGDEEPGDDPVLAAASDWLAGRAACAEPIGPSSIWSP